MGSGSGGTVGSYGGISSNSNNNNSSMGSSKYAGFTKDTFKGNHYLLICLINFVWGYN